MPLNPSIEDKIENAVGIEFALKNTQDITTARKVTKHPTPLSNQ